MSDLDLDAIRERAERATRGPWWAWDRGVGWHIAVGTPGNVDESGRPHEYLPMGARTDLGSAADADFIAATRTDVPLLVAEVERLQRLLGADSFPSSVAFENLNQAYVDMRGLVIEMLRYFYDTGQPGLPSYRSNWVPADTLARWRRIAGES